MHNLVVSLINNSYLIRDVIAIVSEHYRRVFFNGTSSYICPIGTAHVSVLRMWRGLGTPCSSLLPNFCPSPNFIPESSVEPQFEPWFAGLRFNRDPFELPVNERNSHSSRILGRASQISAPPILNLLQEALIRVFWNGCEGHSGIAQNPISNPTGEEVPPT